MKILSIFLLFVPALAEASFCPTFADLKKPIKTCDDNFSLGDVAMDCIEKFETAIRVGQSKVKFLLNQKTGQMKQQQSGAYNTSDASYEDAKKHLMQLIANGLQARSAVKEYLAEMQFPEDYEQPQVTGMSSEEYLKQETCFSAPLEVIQGSEELIGKMVTDLEKSAVAAGFLEKTSEGRTTNMGSLNQAGVGQQNRNSGPSKIPTGKQIRSSDISGTEDKKEKQP